jgi:hypothetical protein
MFPHRVRAMALDGLEDPVSYTADLATALASSLADSDRVFDQFLALCERAGPAGCALAGHGSVQQRVDGMLRRLRQHPVSAPSATPPGELTYGEALTLLKLAALPAPVVWPDAAGLGAGQLPRRPHHAAARHHLSVRPATLRPRLRPASPIAASAIE